MSFTETKKAAYHIGFLDYALFADNPEFCADYVIDLWASFFKAKTWEGLDILAQKDQYIEKTITRVKKLTEDEKLRMIAEARQDQIMQFNDFNDYYKNEIAARDAQLAEKDSALAEKDSRIAEKDSALAEMGSALAKKDSVIAELEAQLSSYKNK